MAIKTRCPECGALKHGRCACQVTQVNQRFDALRETSHRRGYDRRWQKFRAAMLNAVPLCQDCDVLGRATAATEVHHIEKLKDKPERKCDPSNVLCLCKNCHSRRTARGE